jgi:4-diphosphocytidyl-2-C-methyl-D-erythritol kinase
MIFRSPAKLNLFLRVLRKRPDGYHDLATIMQAIDLADTITLKLAPRDTFFCTDPHLPMDSNNLVVKAISLFRAYTRNNRPISLYLDKKIPTQAGLGGGSSNAATVLWGLNELFRIKLPLYTLIELASQLGSDVPFFFSQGRAFCQGRGEIFQELPPCPESYTIYKFSEGASTAEIFKHCKPRPSTNQEIETLIQLHQDRKGSFINDLQPITECLLPSVLEWKQTLPPSIAMTGSGSAYFCEGQQSKVCPSWHVRTISRNADEWY